MNIFLIADTHFFHNKIIDYCERPFKNIEEMHNEMIKRWNSVVENDDLIFHLGDVTFSNFEDTKSIFDQLKGRKQLVKGNHDKRSNSWYSYFFDNVYKEYLLKNTFLLTHRPTKTDYINIHGHTHNTITNLNNNKYKCVSVEKINYTPLNVNSIVS